MIRLSAAALVALIGTAPVFAQSGDIEVTRTATPPKIDGVLDDPAWQSIAPLPAPSNLWVSYNPVRGDTMPERDWIAMSLDSAATGQAAYHLFSNPSGSQMDAINTSASGEQFDADVVWYSVGKTTSDGYIVEMRVPLQTLRFSGGNRVRMNLVFFRKISRLGVSYAWPEMLPGQWVFDRPAHLVFTDLKPRRLMELLPSVTYGVNQARNLDASWSKRQTDPNVGGSGKLGITSAVTLDGTINPDFSQVESDQFQIAVNRRYPLFFSEKRPFFMEGMGLFNVAHGDNMRTAVHTRRIIDPLFGMKLTGTLGKTTFGVLNALDDRPGDVGDRGEAFGERNKLFTIGRATYALRRSDYVGGGVTQTAHDGRSNLVVGGDLNLRPSSSQSITASILSSQTSDGTRDTSGAAAHASYTYETRRVQTGIQVEHYDEDFQMDTAFYNRTGFTAATSYNELNHYPGGQATWLHRVTPFVFWKVGDDLIQDGHEYFANLGGRANFTRQGYINVETSIGEEAWRSQQYKSSSDVFISGGMQITRWFNFYGGGGRGPSLYYDDVDPFQGYSYSGFYGVTFLPISTCGQICLATPRGSIAGRPANASTPSMSSTPRPRTSSTNTSSCGC